MKNASKKIISVLIVMLMLFSSIPFATAVSAELYGDYEVDIRGGTAAFESRNEVFAGLADSGDVLSVTAAEVPGRTFEYWKTSEGDIITDSDFRMLVHDNGYISAHYTDTDEYEFGDWETYRVSDDCEVPSIMIRENGLGDFEFKEVFANHGHHNFGEWLFDYAVPQAHLSTCRICGKTVYEEHDWYDLEVIAEPTHDESGTIKRICSVCSYEFEFEIEPTAEHKWGDYTVVTPPSSSSYGERTHSCVWCGATEASIFLAPDLEELWKDH